MKTQDNQRAAELHDSAAHAHRVAAEHGQGDHLGAHEQSRQALEHSAVAHNSSQTTATAHGITPFHHDDIAAVAHQLWLQRGCPEGSAQQDWFEAAQQLRSRAHTPKGAV